MSFGDLVPDIELILKKALVPLLQVLEEEMTTHGVLSQETLDSYRDRIVAVMRFVQPFLPIAQRLLQTYFPQLIPVFAFAQELYDDLTSNSDVPQ